MKSKVKFNAVHIDSGQISVICERTHFNFPHRKPKENQVFMKLGKNNKDMLKVPLSEARNIEIILNVMFGEQFVIQPTEI